jgi:hypothetical protein
VLRDAGADQVSGRGVAQVMSKSLPFRIPDSSFIFYEAQLDPLLQLLVQVFP